MSYANPEILIPEDLQGVDQAIESLRTDFATLPWLEKSFGRAWEFPEQIGDRKESVPKVYEGGGEYHSVLPNDHLKAQSFILCIGEEEWTDYTRQHNPKQRRLAVVFWFNLKEIDPDADFIFTERLKVQVEALINVNPYTMRINSFVDERAEEVFRGFIRPDTDTRYLMYPYSGFRFELTVGYREKC